MCCVCSFVLCVPSALAIMRIVESEFSAARCALRSDNSHSVVDVCSCPSSRLEEKARNRSCASPPQALIAPLVIAKVLLYHNRADAASMNDTFGVWLQRSADGARPRPRVEGNEGIPL